MVRLGASFFRQDARVVAPALIGKWLVMSGVDKETRYRITETEAYCGEEDNACHASKGKTNRTAIMYQAGGILYVYLIYGMYYMLNVVTGPAHRPEAVLLRGIEGFNGPGKLTRHLQIDRQHNGLDICQANQFRIEDDGYKPSFICLPRVGIDYAGEPWVSMPWRYVLQT